MNDATLIGMVILLSIHTLVVALYVLRHVAVLRRYGDQIDVVTHARGRSLRVSAVVLGDGDPAATIASLNSQTYQLLEVISTVDSSSGEAGPGKTIDQDLTDRAKGEWLLITRTGTIFAREAIASLVAAARSNGTDLFSLYGKVRLRGSERRNLPPLLSLFGLGNPLWRVNDPAASKVALARSECVLVRREAFSAAGGWQPTIDPATTLARTLKASGHRIALADGRKLVTADPSFQSARDWSAALGAESGSKGLLRGSALLVFVVSILPFIWAGIGLMLGVVLGGREWVTLGLFGLAQSLLVLASRRLVDAFTETSAWYGPTHPVGAFWALRVLVAAARFAPERNA